MFPVFPGSNNVLQGNQWKKVSYFCVTSLLLVMRGIEWSLQAFADMQAVRLFLRARAVIKFALTAASTLENTECK